MSDKRERAESTRRQAGDADPLSDAADNGASPAAPPPAGAMPPNVDALQSQPAGGTLTERAESTGARGRETGEYHVTTDTVDSGLGREACPAAPGPDPAPPPVGGQHAGCRVNERHYRERIAALEAERDAWHRDCCEVGELLNCPPEDVVQQTRLLTKERDALRAELSQVREALGCEDHDTVRMIKSWADDYKEACDENDALRAEVERLRETLKCVSGDLVREHYPEPPVLAGEDK